MNKICWYFLSMTFVFCAKAQNLDSLLTVAKNTENDSVKIRMYNKLGFSYIFNDTDKALEVIREGKQLAKSANFNFGLNELTNTHGIYMDVTGQSDSASFYFKKALKMSRDNGFKNIESMCINNLGMLNWNRGNYDTALDYFFQSLKMDEELGSEKSTAISLNNIGLIYQEMKLSQKALDYHKKALAIREKYDLKNEQIASLNNIGINLKNLGRFDEAIASYKKGIDLAREKNNLLEYYALLDNLANAYNESGSADLALKTYLLALNKPDDYKAQERKNLSLYNNIATLYNEKNEPKKALNYSKKGFDLVEKYPEIETISADLNLTTAESYYMLGNIIDARKFKKRFIALKDSIFSEENAKAIADLEVKYETEKKEKEILIQRANLAEKELTIQQKSYQFYGLLTLMVILGIMAYMFYNQQKLKNKQLQKENELKAALIKIETQNKLQEQRLRISRDLHDNIGAQLTFIISSLDNLKYAFDIDDMQLQNKLNTISRFTAQTINELRDTIWAMNKQQISFEDLHSRISNYIDNAHLSEAAIRFTFNVDRTISPELHFSSVEGMNILRIIQEAIHNSLKYANANEIAVNISEENKQTIVVIKDDGQGFNKNEVELGNGINNMKKRAKEIEGQLQISSSLGKGTVIILKV